MSAHCAPVAYAVAHEHRATPGMVYPATFTDLAAARSWAEPGERIWGLVPVEGAIEPLELPTPRRVKEDR